MPRSPRLAHKAPVMQARRRFTMFGLFCYCHFVIRQDHGSGSPSEAQIGCRVGFVLSCFFKSKFNCSLLWPAWAVRPSSTELWLWALIPAWWIERRSSQTEESSQKSEVGNQKWQIVSWKSEVGSRKWEVGSGKWEVRRSNHSALSLNGQKSEIQSSHFVKSEVWSLKLEVGSQKLEDPPRLSYFSKRMTPPFIALGALLITLSILEIELYRNWAVGA